LYQCQVHQLIVAFLCVKGTGYVEGFDTGTDELVFTVNSASAALYDLSIVYAGIYGDKYTTVLEFISSHV
jgi:hypothetical protein